MIRLDTAGRDVTNLPGLWDESDVEVSATNFPHPTITSGQHTNGPATIWIRRAEVGDWYCTGETHLHKVVIQWIHDGIRTWRESRSNPV